MKQTRHRAQELQLIAEAKIRTLLGNPIEDRFEASGVCVNNGSCYVIFDNSSHVARFTLTASGFSGDHELVPLRSLFSGYEDIVYDPQGQRYFALIEAEEIRPGVYQARIEEYGRDLSFVSSQWADFPFTHKNKGLEGLACVYLDGRQYLLGLCEGNKCRGGAAGRAPGTVGSRSSSAAAMSGPMC